MSDDNNDLPQIDELSALKDRAKRMGIKFHPSIGVDALRMKVNEALTGGSSEAPSEEESPRATKARELIETPAQRRVRLKKQAGKLIRVRVSCMNPAKREWEGEVITVANSVVGTFKKYVHFDNDEGWHVPQIILDQLKERKCQVFQTTKDQRGNRIRKGKLVNEFSIEILPPLKQPELEELARRQAAAHSVD